MPAKTKRLEMIEWFESIEMDAAGQPLTRVVTAAPNSVVGMLDIGNCVGFGVMIEPNG